MGPYQDIGWAVAHLKSGGRVRRPHWGAGFYVFSAETTVITFEGSSRLSVFYMVMPSLSRIQPFTCHHDDLLATDWEDAA